MSGPLAAFAVTRRGATPHSDAKSRIRTLQVRSPGDPANPRTPAAEVGATVQSRPNSARRGYAEQGSATHNLRGRPCPASPVDPEVRECQCRPADRNDGNEPVDEGRRAEAILYPIPRHRHIRDEVRDTRDSEDYKEDRAVDGVGVTEQAEDEAAAEDVDKEGHHEEAAR